MTDFSKSWEGWQLKTDLADIEERMLDPEEGIVLVESGIDIHPLLQQVAAGVQQFIAQDFANKQKGLKKSRQLTFNPRSEADWSWYLESGLEQHIPGAKEVMSEVQQVTRELKKPIEARLEPDPHIDLGRVTNSLVIVAQRRSQPRPTHIDYRPSTMWLGATKPALKVMYRGEWITIDDVPPAHLLWWRGAHAYDGATQLEAIRHWAPFRSMSRRVIALA